MDKIREIFENNQLKVLRYSKKLEFITQGFNEDWISYLKFKFNVKNIYASAMNVFVSTYLKRFWA